MTQFGLSFEGKLYELSVLIGAIKDDIENLQTENNYNLARKKLLQLIRDEFMIDGDIDF